MISCATVRKEEIRSHYNLATLFYRLLWGRHIHHGLWDAEESATVAAQRLTETLACEAGIRPGEQVLDVGCGMGSSSIHLAKQFDCRVTGVTLSPVQRWWARRAARWHGASATTDFLCGDAERLEFPPQSFDLVWSIECTEHLFDKPAFFRNAAQWLRPGGRMAICAWLAGRDTTTTEARQQVYDVCEGFLCPSLGTAADYVQWFQQAGLTVEKSYDWTSRVWRTWELCAQRVRRTGVRNLARLLDRNQVLFLDRFETILKAYQTGAMEYGCFIARAPARD